MRWNGTVYWRYTCKDCGRFLPASIAEAPRRPVGGMLCPACAEKIRVAKGRPPRNVEKSRGPKGE